MWIVTWYLPDCLQGDVVFLIKSSHLNELISNYFVNGHFQANEFEFPTLIHSVPSINVLHSKFAEESEHALSYPIAGTQSNPKM